jgi:hypothetical protein
VRIGVPRQGGGHSAAAVSLQSGQLLYGCKQGVLLRGRLPLRGGRHLPCRASWGRRRLAGLLQQQRGRDAGETMRVGGGPRTQACSTQQCAESVPAGWLQGMSHRA